MIEIVSKTDEIIQRLKVQSLNKPEDLKAIIEMNKEMEKVRIDFIRKSRMSEIEASKVILNI